MHIILVILPTQVLNTKAGNNAWGTSSYHESVLANHYPQYAANINLPRMALYVNLRKKIHANANTNTKGNVQPDVEPALTPCAPPGAYTLIKPPHCSNFLPGFLFLRDGDVDVDDCIVAGLCIIS